MFEYPSANTLAELSPIVRIAARISIDFDLVEFLVRTDLLPNAISLRAGSTFCATNKTPAPSEQ